MTQTFLLIDGHALIYRAYHAFGPLTTHDGILVNAVYGFARILLTVIKDFKPEYIVATFDHPTATFRHHQFADYKAHRAAMPDDLIPQVELIKKLVATLNIPQFEVPGFEADDVIGTLVKKMAKLKLAPKQEILAVIVTGDRDTFQLVDDKVHVWLPGRGKGQVDREYDTPAVIEKMGVRPDQIVDLKALMGDASDNIPGIAGIGPKTAARLITAADSLDNLYQILTHPDKLAKASDELKQLLKPNLAKKLVDGYDKAILSQKLAQLELDVPIEIDLPACKVSAYDKAKVIELFEGWDFKSLLTLLPPDEFELSVQEALF